MNPPEVCTALCGLNQCECNPGTYLNECMECVSREKCFESCVKPEPVRCRGPNESLYGCFKPSEAKVCPDIAFSTPRDMFLRFVMTNSTQQSDLCVLNVCDCAAGFMRNRCGECVTPNQCGGVCIREFTCDEPNTVVKNVYSCRKVKKSSGKCKCKDSSSKCSCEKKKCSKGKKCMNRCSKKCRKSSSKSCKSCRSRSSKKCQIINKVCVCKYGYARNNCGVCVPESKANDIVPCACTNPCSLPGQEWQCFTDCDKPTCQNYYDLPAKLCRIESCNYGCYCSARLGLYYNGTACVPGASCPPRDQLPDDDGVISSPIIGDDNGSVSSPIFPPAAVAV